MDVQWSFYYPEGTSKDQAGADRPNQWLAQEVLDAVSQGKSVMFPNGFADTADIRMAYELAGKSQWNLSSFDPGHGDYAPGMKTILEYYDALLFRGWLRPERSGLESKHGSRADAQVHTDTGTLDCELIDRDLADAVNRGIVDDVLVLNFGEQAEGAVYAQAAPIENDSVDIYKTLVNTLLANKETGGVVAKKIDIDGILDALNVPVEAKQRGALADEVGQQETATTPGVSGGQVLPLAGYDPEQARDASGKWTSEGGGAATPSSSVIKQNPTAKSVSPGTSGLVIAPGSKVSMKSADENPNQLFPSIGDDQGTNQNNPQYAVCFAKGTLVLMADGTTKPIETIEAGESVLAAPENDPEAKPTPCKVLEVYHNAPARLLAVTIASPIDPAKRETVRVTAGHKFHVKDKGWTQTEQLKAGDKLWTAEGTSIQVLAVVDTRTFEPVYNLQVEHTHTYFVGTQNGRSSVIAHNDSDLPSFPTADDSQKAARHDYSETTSFRGTHNGQQGTFYQTEYYDRSISGGFWTTRQNAEYGPLRFISDKDDELAAIGLGDQPVIGSQQIQHVSEQIHNSGQGTQEIAGTAIQAAAMLVPGPDDLIVGEIVGKAIEKLAPFGIKAIYKAGKWIFESPEGKELEGKAAAEASAEFKRFYSEGVSSADPRAMHHAWAKYLGGAEEQDLVPLPNALHYEYHSGLDKILPRKWGTAYYDSLTDKERTQMYQKLADYTKAFDAKYGTELFNAMLKEGFPLK